MVELDKHKDLYEQILKEPRVWKFASYHDAFVRRAVFRLLGSALKKHREITPTMISTHILVEALHIDQTGSAYEYSKLLSRLSVSDLEVWTVNYTGSSKKSASKRLCQFLTKGSQGSPPEFWVEITTLLQNLPLPIFVPVHDMSKDNSSSRAAADRLTVLEALHRGITHKDEPRASQSKAWAAYLFLAGRIFPQVSTLEVQRNYLEETIIPIIDQYLKPSLQGTFWTVRGPEQQNICVDFIYFVFQRSSEVLESTWHRLSTDIIEEFQTSLPEQSKDYIASQDRVISHAKKWYSLQAAVLSKEGTDCIRALTISTSLNELECAVRVLTARNGKPYGASAVLSLAASILPSDIICYDEVQRVLVDFAQKKLSDLLLSPSSPYLITFLGHMNATTDVRDTCRKAIENLVDAPDSAAKFKALLNLIASPWLQQEQTSSLLAVVVVNSLQDALKGREESWKLVITSLENRSAPLELISQLLAVATEGLSIENEISAALHSISLAVKYKEEVLKDFCTSPHGPTMLSKLLFLTESPLDSVAKTAQQLTVAIESINSSGKDSSIVYSSMIEIINRGLDMADRTSISYVPIFI